VYLRYAAIFLNHIFIFLFMMEEVNGTVRYKKHKQLFEYQHLLLLTDITWLKL
jgi:hypothetical protein